MLRRIVLVLTLLLVLSIVMVPVTAQGGRRPVDTPGGGGGGGRPDLVFATVTGNLVAETNELGEAVLAMYVGDKRYVLDFGPEWFVPGPCLIGLAPADGDTYLLRNGGYSILLTNEGGTVKAPSSDQNSAVSGLIALAPTRPGNGANITAWGRIEPKSGYDLLRVWELAYGGGPWHWWRWEGQPWQKSQTLSCPASGGE